MGSLPHAGSFLGRHRRTYAIGAAGFACLLAMVVMVPGASAGVARPVPQVTCPSPTLAQVLGQVSEIPKGSHHVLSLWWTFNHLADLEFNGYFALDSGIFLFSAWQAPDGSFYALYVYGGIWQTYQGLLSPVAGVPEPTDGTGTWLQAEFTHFTPAYTPGSMPTHGFLGSVNAGGTTAGLLSNPQVETVGSIDLSAPYFNGYADSTTSYFYDTTAWDYHYFPTSQEYCGQFNFITNGFSFAGDLVT